MAYEVLLVFNLMLSFTVFGVYQPGTPGVSWTENQAYIIKSKLLKLWKTPRKYVKQIDLGLNSNLAIKYVYDPKLKTVNPDYEKCISKEACDEQFRNGKRLMSFEFTERKAVRLAFHDCLGYLDNPKGGCDGCLNFDENG